MKKLFVVLLVMISTTYAFADEIPADDVEIKFRGYEWYAPFFAVDADMLEAPGINEDLRFFEERTNIDTWANMVVRSDPSEECLIGGGVKTTYLDVPVSDYTATANMYYIYALGDNGLDYNYKNAQLIMGTYQIYASDCDDIGAAHVDLIETISSLYGLSVTAEEKSVSLNLWKDDASNTICVMYIDRVCILIYYSPGDMDAVIADYNAALSPVDSKTSSECNTTGL